MNPNNLESFQSYISRGKFGFPRMDVTREVEPKTPICPYCKINTVSKEDETCPECLMDQEEER